MAAKSCHTTQDKTDAAHITAAAAVAMTTVLTNATRTITSSTRLPLSVYHKHH